jgi:hypothetical protein
LAGLRPCQDSTSFQKTTTLRATFTQTNFYLSKDLTQPSKRATSLLFEAFRPKKEHFLNFFKLFSKL